jgi:hypothetical protein
MNRIRAAQALFIAASLAGCHQTVSSNGQVVQLDGATSLAIAVSGATTLPAPVASVLPGPKPGDPIHRVLKSADGKVLFAYDLTVDKGGDGESYRLRLKPAAGGPTFAAAREVTVQAQDRVAVELMEQPADGRKLMDNFTVIRTQSLHSQLMAMHARLYKWVHGE